MEIKVNTLSFASLSANKKAMVTKYKMNDKVKLTLRQSINNKLAKLTDE